MLDLHPDAVHRLNERAEEIVAAVSRAIIEDAAGGEKSRSMSGSTSSSGGPVEKRCKNDDRHVSAHLTEKDIVGPIQVSKSDFLGNRVAYMFRHMGQECWVDGSNYTEIVRISETVQRCGATRGLLSSGMIQETLCKWVEGSITSGAMGDFVAYLESEAEKVVVETELRVPIAELRIEGEFDFGQLHFGTTTSQEIDALESRLLANAGEHQTKVAEYIRRSVRPIQGHAYASIELTAEPARAKEMLLYEAERSVAILRIFSASALHPQAVSGCVLLGTAQRDEINVFAVEKGELSSHTRALKGSPLEPIRLSERMLKDWWKLGCGVYSRLLKAGKLSEYEQAILDATLLYSRCTIAKSVSDKLTYIFSALESVFLENNTEPIQSSLSDRIAFAVGETPEDRRDIIQAVKSAYQLRSRFIHHGARVDDLKKIEAFMPIAWKAFLWLAGSVDHFSSNREMLGELERRKLS